MIYINRSWPAYQTIRTYDKRIPTMKNLNLFHSSPTTNKMEIELW